MIMKTLLGGRAGERERGRERERGMEIGKYERTEGGALTLYTLVLQMKYSQCVSILLYETRVCVCVCLQNWTNFYPYALISTPNVP